MRTIVRISGFASMLLIAACSGDSTVDEAFKKDLELASTASPITLQSSGAGAQVISAIERTAPPAVSSPKRVAPAKRTVKHTSVARTEPVPMDIGNADASIRVSEPVEIAQLPSDPAPMPSSRPHPVTPSSVGVYDGDIGIRRGTDVGSIISVVLRGGHAGIDDCDPRVDGRRRGATIAINNRIPVVGTFPGGRSAPGTGRVRF